MSEKLPKATYGSPERPLKIGDIELPCYVLDDGRRVLVQRGMVRSLAMKRGTAGKRIAGDRLVQFTSTKSINPFVSEDLAAVINNPIKFKTAKGAIAHGYEATVLADLCDAVLAAREAGALNPQQRHIADRCELLVRGFARVGIVALVDEVTGYQQARIRHALAEILDKFIAKELSKWAKTFPDEFYREMFRLKGWPYDPKSVKRPSVIGRYTEDLVYKRLAPGVLKELKRLNPTDEKGHRKHKHFQWLTQHEGYWKLKSHLDTVTAFMRGSSTWDRFYRLLQRSLPQYGETIDMFPEFWGGDEDEE